jgi:hypothetical protein
MADTTVEADAGSGGALFAVDDISGTTHPYVKIELGAAGQDNNPVHSSNPMPIEGGASGRPVSTFAVNTPNPSSTFIMGSAAGSVPVSTYAVNAAATSVQSTWAVGQDIPISTFARADNFISTNNSWTATTAASSTWTANGDDVSNYNAVTIQLATDVDSAASSMRFEFSNDNTNWDDTYNFTMDVSASSTRRFQFPVTAQYFRNRYTNGGTDQGYFRVQTIYHSAAPGTSIHRLGDDTSPDRSAQVVKSAIMAIGSGGGANFVNVGATNGGNLKISVEESVQVDVNIAAQDDPVSTYAVNNPAPVGTQSTWALNKTSTHMRDLFPFPRIHNRAPWAGYPLLTSNRSQLPHSRSTTARRNCIRCGSRIPPHQRAGSSSTTRARLPLERHRLLLCSDCLLFPHSAMRYRALCLPALMASSQCVL